MSWNTVDARNNKLYVRIDYLLGVARHTDFILELPIKNYSNVQYAAALQVSLNGSAFASPSVHFTVTVDADNILTLTLVDAFEFVKLSILSDDDLMSGAMWYTSLSKRQICSMNGILRIDKTINLTK